MEDFVLSAFSGGMREYHFDAEDVRVTLHLDSGLFQSEDINQHVNQEMHHHPYYEWFFVTKGRMRLNTAAQSWELGKYDFIIVPPGLDHCVHFLANGTARYNLNFSFCANGLRSAQKTYTQLRELLERGGCISGAGGEELADVNRRLSQLCGTDRSAMLCACFWELLCSVQDTLRAARPSAFLERFLRDTSLTRSQRLEQLIHTYYMYDCSLGFVADCLDISTRQLNRIIRKEFGATFHNLLCHVRICSARQLLAKTDFNVYEIAQWVGYTSLCSFYHAFKAECGCLPTEYRKRLETQPSQTADAPQAATALPPVATAAAEGAACGSAAHTASQTVDASHIADASYTTAVQEEKA